METEDSAKSAETRLDELAPQTCGIVCRVKTGNEDVRRLKALGICVGRRIEVVKSGDPLIIRVFGSRIGLSVALAAHVWIEQCAPVPQRKLTTSKPG